MTDWLTLGHIHKWSANVSHMIFLTHNDITGMTHAPPRVQELEPGPRRHTLLLFQTLKLGLGTTIVHRTGRALSLSLPWIKTAIRIIATKAKVRLLLREVT